MLILAAALLLLISTLAGGYAFSQISTTVAVIGMAETVPAGQIVDREDLTTIQVNEGSGLATVPADQLSDVVGLRAVTDLPAGSTLTPDSVAEVLVPTSGESIVGISTAPGTAPATGLVPGAEVLLVPLAADGEQLGKNAAEPVAGRVVSVSADAGQAGSQIDVAVASQAAPALQRLAAAQRLAIIIVSKER